MLFFVINRDFLYSTSSGSWIKKLLVFLLLWNPASFWWLKFFFSPVSTFWRGLSSDLTAFQGTVCQNWQSNRLYGWHPWGWASLCPQCVWLCWAALLRLVNWQPCVRLLIREFPLGLRTGPGKLRGKKYLSITLYNLFSRNSFFVCGWWPKANFFEVVFHKRKTKQEKLNLCVWTHAMVATETKLKIEFSG